MAPRVARRHPPVLVLPPPPSSSIRDDDTHINIDRNSKPHEHSQQQTTTNDANANSGEFERVESIPIEGSGDSDSVVMFSPSSTTLRDTHNNNEGVLLHSRRTSSTNGRVINDKGLDVYEQLDEFEHLLDVELESMEKLGFLDGNSRCAASAAEPIESGGRMRIATTSRSGTTYDSKYRGEDYDESDSDSCEETNNVDIDGDHSDNRDSARSYQCNNSESDDDEEERLTLRPPPSSWFLRLDGDGDGNNIHSDDGAIKSATNDNNDPISQKRCTPSSATSDSADDDAATAPPATATDQPPATTSTATIASTSQFESMLSQITALSSNATPTTTTISIATTLLTSLISQTNIPTILQEISSSVISRGVHKLRMEYSNLQCSIGPNRYKRASDIGNANGRGYYCPEDAILLSFPLAAAASSASSSSSLVSTTPQFVVYRHPSSSLDSRRSRHENDDGNRNNNSSAHDELNSCISSRGIGAEVRFTSLSWIERQLVREWRTYEWIKGDDKYQEATDEGVVDKQEEEEESDHDGLEKINDNICFSLVLSNGDDDDDDGCNRGGISGSDCHENTASDHNIRHTREQNQQQLNDESSGNCSNRDEEGDNGVIDDGINKEDPLFDIDEDEFFYNRARTMAPRALPRPMWEKATSCYTCRRIFGPALHRHHCRRCGHSYCHAHSNLCHRLPHLGYDVDVPERVCRKCKAILDERDLEERVSWRLARCRDLLKGELTPYFETGIDTVEDAAYRLTRLAITFARNIPLGAQAYVAVETADILRKHGLKGVYGLLLRKEFLAAADLLCRVLGINRTNWPLSVHELSAAIFYALAQHRALRGLRPDGEELIHSLKPSSATSGRVRCDNEDVTNVASTEGRCVTKDVWEDNNEPVHEDFDANRTVTWAATTSQKCLVEEVSESVLDETDVYDPLSEKVVDILAMSTSDQRDKGERFANENTHKSSSIDGDSINGNGANLGDTTTVNIAAASCSKLPFEPVCEHVPDALISSLLFYAPLALEFIYAECEVDMQLLGAQQGWRLVFASLDQNHHHSHTRNKEGTCLEGDDHFSDRPAAALFAHDERKVACLSIRGTATIQDVVTDIRAVPVPFPQQEEEKENGNCEHNTSLNAGGDWTSVCRGSGLALCGMAGAAANLFRETADPLLYLAFKGYKIRIVGHSLGGGVAALLGILMLGLFEKQGLDAMRCMPSNDGGSVDDRGFVHVYSYGTPSCVDATLADNPLTLAMCTSVVLHDDVVPRLTPTSVRGLLKHLLYIRQTWVKTHLSDDLNAITERAYQAWPNRLRGSFTLLKKKGVASAKRLKKSCEKRIQGEAIRSIPAFNVCNEADAVRSNNNTLCVLDESRMYAEKRDEGPSAGNNDGLDVEGDLFFDTLGDPLNESDDESSTEVQQQMISERRSDNEWVPFDEPPMEENNESSVCTDQVDQPLSDADASPQILEETPLPRMYIPGRIVHIYSHRGGYKAAFVPRKFRSLRRVSMAGNMLTDHMASRYYEGLLEVKAVRSAKQNLPHWVGFADDCTCSCCASLFTWASTSNTEAQEARDKHNCRACGCLVCDPCSKRRIPMPSIGITAPVRVCDRCYWGGTTLGSAGKTTGVHSQTMVGVNTTPTSRRSVVVDELASRIPTISS